MRISTSTNAACLQKNFFCLLYSNEIYNT